MKSLHKKLLTIFWLIVAALLISFVISDLYQTSKDQFRPSEAKLLNRDFNLWIYDGKVYYRDYDDVVTPVDVDYKNLKYYNLYFKDNKNVWVSNWGFGNGEGLPFLKLITSPPIDTATFTVLPSPMMFWAKDKFGLIYQNERVSGFDMPFETFDQPYIKKDNRFYFLTRFVKLTIDPIPTLPSSVNKFFSEDYAADGMSVYYVDPYQTKKSTKLEDANPADFKQLSGNYWTDGQNIYYTYHKLTDASLNDLRDIKGDYFMTTKHVYWKENIISNVSYAEFKSIKPDSKIDSCGNDYWTDGSTIFYEGKNLKINYQKANKPTFIGDHPGSFACLSYIWDDMRAAYYEKELKDFDSQTFKVLSLRVARNKNHFYIDGEILPGDPDQLEKDYAEGKLNSILYPDEDAY